MKADLKEKNVIEKVKLDVAGRYMGSKILEIYSLSKSFGDKKIVNDFSYKFSKGEKVGIIGRNGVGKTTFLNMIMEKETFDSGKIVKGESIHFGYYTQDGFTQNSDDRIIDSVKKIANYIKLSDGTEISASLMLERFLFPARVQQGKVSDLSGGELKRLNLLKVFMTNPNFLILDEPTNDLDIMTLNVLEEFLMEFKGCLIIITHDRYFMDKIVDHLFVFEGDAKIKDFPGNYSTYREVKELEEPKEVILNVPASPITPNNSKLANALLNEVKRLEDKKEKLIAKMFEPGLDFDILSKMSKEVKELESEIDRKTDEWMEIA
jgi:ATP-binding cassette subfamily F protein uup